MLILGIESSCDDAAAAVIETATAGSATIRSSTVANQDDIHRAYGGIVPELASRNHVVTILPVIERALGAAGCRLADIEGIAVTRGPGLVGSLLVGLMCAKGLAQSVGLPMVGVNHIEGHLLAPMLEHRVAFPYLALVVSGGHTALFAVENFGRYRRLGQTRDDAAGEAFDKVAKLMGLGYPGGKVIDDLSKQGNRKRVKIPRAHVRGAPLDFSFSGVKTAMATMLAERGGAPLRPAHPAPNNFAARNLPINDLAQDLTVEDLAASFQEAVVDMLLAPTIAAARELAADTVVLTGGVAANSRLRERLAEAARRRRPRARRALAQVLHRQRRDDRIGGELSPVARRARRSLHRRRRKPAPLAQALLTIAELMKPLVPPSDSGPARTHWRDAATGLGDWHRLAAELIAIVYIALIAEIAYAAGAPYILFPELGALSHDVFTRPRGTWAGAPILLAITPVLTGVIGIIFTRALPYGFLSVLLTVGGAVAVILALKSSIAPAISAGLLPLVLGVKSWWYPPGILLGTVILAVLSVLWRKLSVAQNWLEPLGSMEVVDEAIEQTPQGSYWLIPLMLFVAAAVAAVKLTGLRFLLFPPLVVIGFEMFGHTAICPWAKRPLILPVACLLTAATGLLFWKLLGVGPAAVACSMAGGVVVLRIFDLHVPPALAVALLPFVMQSPTIAYPFSVGIGTLLMTLWFLFYQSFFGGLEPSQ